MPSPVKFGIVLLGDTSRDDVAAGRSDIRKSKTKLEMPDHYHII